MEQILVPVSPGEVLDKITILEIKSERMSDPLKLKNVRRELELLATGALEPTDGRLRIACEQRFEPGQRVTLRDGENRRLAILTVEESGELLVGPVQVLDLPNNPGFAELRKRPAEMRELLTGRKKVFAYWVEDGVDGEALRKVDGTILFLVARAWSAGPTVRDFAAVKAALAVAEELPGFVNLIPGPVPAERRELVQRNYGATEAFAGPGGGSFGSEKRRGFCVWFTGLPSSGKSTIAQALAVSIAERGREVSMLDGDVVRMHLSKGLGFSREDRDTNILRIGFVASEIVRHQGAVICAAVSPYEAARERAREMVGTDRFVLVHVATPAEVCEQRDVKGFYARARSGAMSGMTGVDDPYEIPVRADMTLATTDVSPAESARRIMGYLEERGLLG